MIYSIHHIGQKLLTITGGFINERVRDKQR